MSEGYHEPDSMEAPRHLPPQAVGSPERTEFTQPCTDPVP